MPPPAAPLAAPQHATPVEADRPPRPATPPPAFAAVLQPRHAGHAHAHAIAVGLVAAGLVIQWFFLLQLALLHR